LRFRCTKKTGFAECGSVFVTHGVDGGGPVRGREQNVPVRTTVAVPPVIVAEPTAMSVADIVRVARLWAKYSSAARSAGAVNAKAVAVSWANTALVRATATSPGVRRPAVAVACSPPEELHPENAHRLIVTAMNRAIVHSVSVIRIFTR